MTPQEQAAAERDQQVREAEERTRKAMEELQRHGQAAAALTRLGRQG